MADPIQRVTSSGVHFDFAGLKANEMVQVTKWTGITKRREFYRAILDEDPAAVLAAFSLVRWRETGEVPRWGDVDVDLDDLNGELHVDGRVVTVELETDDDGAPIIAVVDKIGRALRDSKGNYVKPSDKPDANETVTAIAKRHPDGEIVYRYKDDGELVPPTQAATTTSGSTVSPNTEATPSSTASDSGTPTTDNT